MAAYFVEHRRGELEEIRDQLSNPKIKNKRDIIKKVIAYMSLGVDVSKLYTNMIMAASTTDPVQKKMVYSYLCAYAQEKSDLALLCINTLQKDCRDQEPMVRGLALRSLCSLRMKSICEYALDPLRALVNDRSAYVRRTAVLQWLKLYSFQPQQLQEAEPQLLDNIFNMINDNDPQVVMNALHSLQEILALVVTSIEQQQIENANNGLENAEIVVPFNLNPELLAQRGVYYYLSQNLILQLFNRFDTFPEWGQAYILELATHYTPADEDEMFSIMNILDALLSHNNTSVLLAAIKLFLHITANNKEIQDQVYHRIKTPLITALLVSPIEIVYVILSHIKVVAIKAPHVFRDEFRYFFIKYNDLLCVKILKLQILALIATSDTAQMIIEEFHEYTYDKEDDVVRSAITGISTVAILIPSSLDQAVDVLIGLLEFKREALANYVALSCRDILRKYPAKYVDIVPSFQALLQERDLSSLAGGWRGVSSAKAQHGGKVSSTFDHKKSMSVDTSAICAIVWMLGEFGEDIKAAPYVLEQLIDSLIEAVDSLKAQIETGAIQPNQITEMYLREGKEGGLKTTVVMGDVQFHLLTACMKLIFKRPAEIQAMLGRLFSVLLSPDHSLGSGVEHLIDVPTKQQAVLYYRMLASSVGETSKIFLSNVTGSAAAGIAHSFWEFEALHDSQSKQMSYLFTEFNTLSIIYGIPQSAFKRLHRAQLQSDDDEAAANAEHQAAAASTLDDSPSHIASTTTTPKGIQYTDPAPPGDVDEEDPCQLQADVELEPETFQELWGTLPEFPIEFEISQAACQAMEQIEQQINQQNLHTMASGNENGEAKIFFYGLNADKMGNDEQPLVFLIEVVVVLGSGAVTATMKTNGSEDQSTHVFNIIGSIMTEF